MVVALFVGVLLALSAAPSPQPSVTPAPYLRQVVYNVTIGETSTAAATQYEGHSSSGRSATDRGTVTVDIMAVANDNLGIEVTELMNKKGSPYTFKGAVTPDGTVLFEAASIEDVTRELLQYFGTHFVPPDKVNVGQSWTINYDRNGTQVQTQFTITKIDGDLMTLHELQKAKFQTYNETATTEGTIVLKPSVLVPVSGDVHKRLEGSGLETQRTQELTLHFERASDSRDTPAK